MIRTIKRTGQFRRDYKREARGEHRVTLDGSLEIVFKLLAHDRPLEPRHNGHALTGN
jgi:mRNA interferase YafQ